MNIQSRPQRGDTYGLGNRVTVQVVFDEEVTMMWQGGGPPPLRLALEIGNETRYASIDSCVGQRRGHYRCGGPIEGFWADYYIQAGDYDPDGLSIEVNAIRLNGTRIRDLAGNDADVSLGPHAVVDDPIHKVDGGLDHPPMISSMGLNTVPKANDTYGLGEEIRVIVWFDEHVTVTGAPTLAIEIGSQIREATHYPAKFDPEAHFFAYRVQATDVDTNGISVGADALRLNGGSIRDDSGNDVPTDLAAWAITDNPRHKVDGRAVYAPGVDLVAVLSEPLHDDTYGRGETIEVRIEFDETLFFFGPSGHEPFELAIQVGGVKKRASGVGLFRYEVQVSDYDPDGISIPPDALRFVGGWTIYDGQGRDVTDLMDFNLGAHAITNDPSHRVDGRPLTAVGTPPLRLLAGHEATAVDLSQVFHGLIVSATAVSSNPEVAAVAISDAVLTVSPLLEGTATIDVTARNATEVANAHLEVTVVTDPAETIVLQHTLAAFGRNLLASVTRTIEGRFDATPRQTTLMIAGRQLPLGTSGAVSDGAGRSVPMAGLAHSADSTLPASDRPAMFPGSPPAGRLRGGDLLRGSQFLLALDDQGTADESGGAAEPPAVRWTVWGGGDLQSFEGEPADDAAYDGHLLAGHVGLDVGTERWLAGTVVSRSTGQASYGFSGYGNEPVGAGTGAGELTMTLTSVQPYLRWSPRDGTSVWTIAGAGTGSVHNLRRLVGDRQETGELSMRLGVVGGRQTLVSPGQTELAVRGDAGVVQLATGDGEEVIDGLSATVQRYRIGMEVSHTQQARAADATSFVVVGARHDSGDGLTGNGLELEGGVRVTHAGTGLGIEARGHMLAMHTTHRYQERGLSVMTLWTPGGTSGQGLSVAVTPQWGTGAGGATLWRDHLAGRRSLGEFVNDAASVDTRVSYGMALGAGRMVMPFSELAIRRADSRRLRVGMSVTSAPHMSAPLNVEVAGERIVMTSGWSYNRLALTGGLGF
ncbi:MAG: hypothetical protein F4Y45_14170 [Acidobacteria bacterium]|nr:hypothetical protein [Acidobacteriota bacterium]MYJ02956.1 hypothetical protein [Acidobacteriota bacterium]